MRDIRDPQAVGEILLDERARNPHKSILWVYDNVLTGMWIANYGEDEDEFKARVYGESAKNSKPVAA